MICLDIREDGRAEVLNGGPPRHFSHVESLLSRLTLIPRERGDSKPAGAVGTVARGEQEWWAIPVAIDPLVSSVFGGA